MIALEIKAKVFWEFARLAVSVGASGQKLVGHLRYLVVGK